MTIVRMFHQILTETIEIIACLRLCIIIKELFFFKKIAFHSIWQFYICGITLLINLTNIFPFLLEDLYQTYKIKTYNVKLANISLLEKIYTHMDLLLWSYYLLLLWHFFPRCCKANLVCQCRPAVSVALNLLFGWNCWPLKAYIPQWGIGLVQTVLWSRK